MELVTNLTVIFLAASTVLLLLNKFDHPVLPGYIIAGVLAGFFVDGMELMNLAQIGVAFLVFVFGLQFRPESLKSTAYATFNTTGAQILIAGFLGYLGATLIGFNRLESFYFAAAAAVSSTLVGLQLTEQEIQNNLLHGRLSESIHLIQDLVILTVIAVAFSTTIESAVNSFMYSALIIVAGLFIRRYLFEFMAEQAGKNRELLTMGALTLLIGFIAASEFFGVPMVIGSFAAGLAASKFPHNIELLDTIGSIKDFFAAIFFVVLGALLTFPTSISLITAATLIAITSIATPLVIYFGLKDFGYDDRTALLTGLSLDQVSELSLVLAMQGLAIGAISQQMFEGIILGATASMILSSYTKRYEENIYGLTGERKSRDIVGMEDHIILLGYDVQGTKIVEELLEEDANLVVIDNHPERINDLEEKDVETVYGDAMDSKTWEEAGIDKAELIVSTVPSRKISERVINLDADADKIVRTDSAREALEFLDRGAVYVTIPDLVASEKLLDHLKGIDSVPHYHEEIRRKNLLEVRKYLRKKKDENSTRS